MKIRAFIPKQICVFFACILCTSLVSCNSDDELSGSTADHSLTVPVSGIQNIRAVRYSVGNELITGVGAIDGKVVRYSDGWVMTLDEENEKEGVMSVSFTATDALGSIPAIVEFLLIDNKTVISHDCPIDKPAEVLHIDDVPRAQAGFDAIVDDWDVIEYEINF